MFSTYCHSSLLVQSCWSIKKGLSQHKVSYCTMKNGNGFLCTVKHFKEPLIKEQMLVHVISECQRVL